MRLARKIEGAKKSLCHCIGGKRLKCPFQNAADDLVTTDTEKTETLDASSTSVFTKKVCQAFLLFGRVQRTARQG